ncbi:hypothetical protein LSH36_902g01011 [Paralvinella palmiformis]|uniref:Uncharacterized protein n=1 Tax=Paralvinella palmiformis TaxID=53620 RepID=A0AAD9IXT4_9ANNE|nr:hypothetical protein LSH36_902g01011 [Paralvinella palmiformis]
MKLDNETGWTKSGVLLSPTEQPRSYIVVTESGSVMRRNRKRLQHNPIPEEQQNAVPHSSDEQETVILNKNIPEHIQNLPQPWNTVPLGTQQSVNIVPQSPKPSVVDTSTPKTVNINTKPSVVDTSTPKTVNINTKPSVVDTSTPKTVNINTKPSVVDTSTSKTVNINTKPSVVDTSTPKTVNINTKQKLTI